MRVIDRPSGDFSEHEIAMREDVRIPRPSYLALRPAWDLLFCYILTSGLILQLTWPGIALPSALRSVLAPPTLLFCPGYLLSAALFARYGEMSEIERFALSIVFSIGLIVFAGLGLYFMALPIKGGSLGWTLVATSTALAAAGMMRRSRLRTGDAFTQRRRCIVTIPRSTSPFWPAILFIGMGAFSAVGFRLVRAPVAEHYTEFSIMSAQTGKADTALTSGLGAASKVAIAVVNHEHGRRSYAIHIGVDGVSIDTLRLGMLEDGATWSQLVRLPAFEDQQLHHISLELYLADQTTSYRELHLWMRGAAHP